MRTAFHVAQSFAKFPERKHLVHDGSEFVKNQGAVHGLEHRAAADEDALNAHAFHEYRERIDRSTPGQDADQTDATAHADGTERLGECAGAADLYDVIDASTAREFAGAAAPFRRGLVVNALGGPELVYSRKLPIAAGCSDDACPQRPGELEREE